MSIDPLDPHALVAAALAAATYTKDSIVSETSGNPDLLPIVSGIDGRGKPIVVVQVHGPEKEVADVARLLTGCGLYAAVTIVMDATAQEPGTPPPVDSLLAYALTPDGLIEARAQYETDLGRVTWRAVGEIETVGPFHDAIAHAWESDTWETDVVAFMEENPEVDIADVRTLIYGMLAARGHFVMAA